MLIRDVNSKRIIQSPICTGPVEYTIPREAFMSLFKWAETRKKVLYVHIPFCKRKCKYCKWQSSVGDAASIERHFITTLPSQIDMYKPVFDAVKFDEVYFGGGTPTCAHPFLLEELFKRIPGFMDIPNKCIETSPDTLTESHVELFKQYKFNYISMGVQTLSPLITQMQNRTYVSHQQLVNIADYLRDARFMFNFDMICFLDHGDIRDIPQFQQDMDFIINVAKPTFVTVHQEYNTHQTFEKTEALISMLRDIVDKDYQWRCVNSRLLPTEVKMDTIYRAEYKLASDHYDYMHHLWDKWNLNLKNQYDVISLGSTKEHPLCSFVGDTILNEEENQVYEGPWPEFPPCNVRLFT